MMLTEQAPIRWLVFALTALMNCAPTPSPSGPPAFRGLIANPRYLAFTCVIPGCDTTETVRVISNVNRRIAIKRIILSNPNPEYTLISTQTPPFILGAASEFSVEVHFAAASAPSTEALEILVTYTDASAEESANRVPAGELKIPLVKRLVGEPMLVASPASINFGVVSTMGQKEVPVTVRNGGFGNIALEVDRADSGVAELHVQLPASAPLVPDSGVIVPFVYSPMVEGYLKTEIQLSSSTPGIDPVWVSAEGTSYQTAHAVLEPEETPIEMGEIPIGERRQVSLKLANVGGGSLNVVSLSPVDPTNRVTASFAGGVVTTTLGPLERAEINVEVNGISAGPIDIPLRVASNDPLRPQLDVPVRALITEPKIQAAPTALDWGIVPMGWVVSKPVELKNVGYGALTVKRLTTIGGTSNLFTFKNLPSLPLQLPHNGRIAFEVEFRSQTAATFTGAVSVETDDPSNPFSEIPVTAAGGLCSASCPIAHGTPSCAALTCSVGSCDLNWHDTDLQPSNGCECQDIGSDPGGFCSTGIDKGTLADNGAATNHSGIVHSADDEDYIRFFAEDRVQVFGEDFDVRVTLTSADPNIYMCVSRYETPTNINECYPDANKQCGLKSFRRDGSYGTEDGALYFIKVYRDQSAPATCAPYTLYMSNG